MTRRELANAVRMLAVDAVEAAKSGHPGAPLGMADMAEALWRHGLRHNPGNPLWADRDRFVLSNGHASMLLYALLHLTGYAVSMDDLRNFRQLGAITAGHPEHGLCPGVEATTGPLGQGLAMAVGMALAERSLAARFNREDFNIVDHRTYVFLGDGCMMEGVSHEAASLAGAQKLGKLIALYDANGISIDGEISGWFGEDSAARFTSYGWQVQTVDGHDFAALDAALGAARSEDDRPSLIICRTHIGFGAPNKEDSRDSHGAPLGADEVKGVRAALKWDYEPFFVPEEIYKEWSAKDSGAATEKAWNELFSAYAAKWPDAAAEFRRRMAGDLPDGLDGLFAELFVTPQKAEASRISSRKVLDKIGAVAPELIGGSADLSDSVGTMGKGFTVLTPENPGGSYLHYGVREFGMGAIMNGLSLHGGFVPYAGTFLVFSDYAKNAIRLSALMKRKVVWVLTHDSIGLGEDGPTHQPVEQIPGLRLTPGLDLWRPCDAVETAVAWENAIKKDRPSCLALSRQSLPQLSDDAERLEGIRRGGYILRDCEGQPEAILIATGSEVGLALEAEAALRAEGRKIRVVSMPCTEIFDAQEQSWRDHVLPPKVRARVAVEAAAPDFWRKYVGLDGAVVGMENFGESAPASRLFEYFGFTAAHVAEVVKKTIS